VVAIFDDCEGTEMISVNFNNIGMGMKAAEVFLDSGHKKPGILLPKGLMRSADRQQGFQRTVKERLGITAAEFFIDPGESPEDQYAVAHSIRDSKITALYSVGHELTVSLCPCLENLGIDVPKDLSILSSSSIPDVPGTIEKVDILHMDFEALGRIAYRALTDYRRGEVSQKCYLVNPPHHAHGTVRALVDMQNLK
jgi:DNA-binding LacI/PurR family transcriptional regulator